MITPYSNRIKDSSSDGVRALSTVLKTLKALDALAHYPKPSKLTELAAMLHESKSATFQRLLTLIRAGWVEQIDDGAYRLTLKAVGIGDTALEQAQLGSGTASLLTQLSALVGETASMAVLRDGHPYIVQRAEIGGVLPAHPPMSPSLTLHYSASGRVLYAYADETQAAEIRALAGEVPDDATCLDVIALGYALSREGQDVRAIAAPIFDHRGVCISALSLIAPATRFQIERFKQPLLEVAGQITKLLHGKPPLRLSSRREDDL